jgi:type II secretory pathway pseudopilin PulG
MGMMLSGITRVLRFGVSGELKQAMALTKQRGVSLLELMAVVAITMIVTGIGFISLQPMLKKSHMDNGYDTTLMVLRNTRNLAITQSHQYYVNFNPAGFPAGTIQVQYQPPAVGGGAAPPLQQVSTYTLPVDVSFKVLGFPAAAPDGFGTGGNAIDFGQNLAGAPMNYVVFMPDGSSRDNVGNYNSGVVYLSLADNNIYNSRAITVWGSTGRVRGWKLTKIGNADTWVQQ